MTADTGQDTVIVVGSDHAGFDLKQKVTAYLVSKGFTVEDAGCYSDQRVDYPDFAAKAIQTMKEQQADRTILVCGSGIGVSIAANRFNGIRAVLANDVTTAKWSRLHNDANVLCLGGRIITPDLSYQIIDTWLETEFEGGRHQGRIDQLDTLNAKAPSGCA